MEEGILGCDMFVIHATDSAIGQRYHKLLKATIELLGDVARAAGVLKCCIELILAVKFDLAICVEPVAAGMFFSHSHHTNEPCQSPTLIAIL